MRAVVCVDADRYQVKNRDSKWSRHGGTSELRDRIVTGNGSDGVRIIWLVDAATTLVAVRFVKGFEQAGFMQWEAIDELMDAKLPSRGGSSSYLLSPIHTSAAELLNEHCQ
jgi:hypothetical protein